MPEFNTYVMCVSKLKGWRRLQGHYYNAVDIRMCIADVRHEVGDGLHLGDIQSDRLCVVMPMSMHKICKFLLSTPDSNDEAPFFDESVC